MLRFEKKFRILGHKLLHNIISLKINGSHVEHAVILLPLRLPRISLLLHPTFPILIIAHRHTLVQILPGVVTGYKLLGLRRLRHPRGTFAFLRILASLLRMHS